MKLTVTFKIVLLLVTAISFSQIKSADSYFREGEKFQLASQPDSAVYYFERAATAYRQDNNKEGVVNSFTQIGAIYTRKDDYVKAKYYLNQALEIGSSLEKDNLSLARVHLGLGVVYSGEKNFTQSLAFHQMALNSRLAKLGEIDMDVATSFGNIGNVHFSAKDYDKAIAAHKNALKIRRKIFGEKGTELTQSYVNLGNAYREKSQFDKSLSYFYLALKNKIVQRGTNHPEVNKIYKSIGDIYLLKGEKEKAQSYFEKSTSR